MKLLVIHSQTGAKQWVTPLRSEGWGVLTVSSLKEAEQVLQFHGSSLDALVISKEHAGVEAQKAVAWLEQFKKRKEYAAVISILVSENDKLSAETLKKQIQSAKAQPTKKAVGESFSGLALEEVTGVLSQPEISTVSSTGKSSITLSSPSVMLGGKTVIREKISDPTPLANEDRTMMISTNVDPLNDFAPQLLQPLPVFDPEPIEYDSIVEVPLQRIGPSTQPPPQAKLANAIRPSVASPVGSRLENSPDVEVLRSYLSMREQDVAVLTGQLRSSQERIEILESQLKVEKVRGTELHYTVKKQDQKLQEYDRDKLVEQQVLLKQVDDLMGQLKEKNDKTRLIEAKLKVAVDEVEKIKDRVRQDIRRIRTREKELENQLEILKKDSSALISARDEKLIELKRKLDLLEFNLELEKEKYAKEKSASEELKKRLKDASTAMKQAGGFLEQEH